MKGGQHNCRDGMQGHGHHGTHRKDFFGHATDWSRFNEYWTEKGRTDYENWMNEKKEK
jgi:hypothetical protein